MRFAWFIPAGGLLLTGLAIGAAAFSAGNLSPGYAGPDRNRIYATDIALRGAKVIWDRQIGKGYSSFASFDGKLLTMGNSGGKDHVLCLEAETGKTLWDYAYPCSPGPYPGPRCTPATDGKYVYTLSRDGRMLCLTADKGQKVWEKFAGDYQCKPERHGLSCSALLMGDTVYFDLGKIIALEKATGKTKWETRHFGTAYSSPMPFEAAGKTYLACFPASGLVILEADGGKVVCEYPFKTEYNINAALPVVMLPEKGAETLSDVRIFISSAYGNGGAMLKLKPNRPEVLWTNKNMGNHFNSCVYHEGYLYGVDGLNNKGVLRCIEAKTGKTVWEKKDRNISTGSLVLVGDTLVVLGERGKLFYAKPDPKGFNPFFSTQLFNGKKIVCWTIPAYANSRLFVRDEAGRAMGLDVK